MKWSEWKRKSLVQLCNKHMLYTFKNCKRNTFMIWWILDKRHRNKMGPWYPQKGKQTSKTTKKCTQSIGKTNYEKKHISSKTPHCKVSSLGVFLVAKKNLRPCHGESETRAPNGNGGETAVGAELKIADTLFNADANEWKKTYEMRPFCFRGSFLTGVAISEGKVRWHFSTVS